MYEAINAFIIVVLKDSVERVMHITTNVISSRGSMPIIIIKCLQHSPVNVQKGSQCLHCAFMEGFPSNLKHAGCHSEPGTSI